MLTPIVKAFQMEDCEFQICPIIILKSEIFNLKCFPEFLLLTFSSIAS